MRIEPAALAKSIGALTTLDGNEDFPEALQQVVDATAALISAKVISERLGHASVAFTLQTYSHVIPGMDRDAAAAVADLILSSTQEGPGTVVPDPSANKAANNGPQNDAPKRR